MRTSISGRWRRSSPVSLSLPSSPELLRALRRQMGQAALCMQVRRRTQAQRWYSAASRGARGLDFAWSAGMYCLESRGYGILPNGARSGHRVNEQRRT
jgi:hypothetical protein